MPDQKASDQRLATATTATAPEFSCFADFYPFYLGEHRHPLCRALHYVGSWLALLTLIAVVATAQWGLLWLPFVIGYVFAWVGHFYVEHNRPATFRHPLYSFIGDWRMWWSLHSEYATKLSRYCRRGQRS